MSEHLPEIQKIPIDAITVLNPRERNKREFDDLVASIARLGLKKPVTVSQREDGRYDLVCGQGRIEAFLALGQTAIPAIVLQIPKDDCFVLSLVENMARRHQTPLELLHEIASLRERGYSHTQIASKLDFSVHYIQAACYLLERGEERLLAAMERGVIPPAVAMEIVQAKDTDVQASLAEAYETGALPGNQVVAIRRIIEQRNSIGKNIKSSGGGHRKKSKQVSASALVRTYRKEAERQSLLVKKATLAQTRLLFVVNALRRLLAEEHFVALLRAERMESLPRALAERVEQASAR